MNKPLLLLIAGAGIAVGIAFQKNQSQANRPDESVLVSNVSYADEEQEQAPSVELENSMPATLAWPENIETARQTILDPSSPLERKAEALKALQFSPSEEYPDPRSKSILDEAAWILGKTAESEVLNNTLEGIQGANYEDLIEPVIACLLNHKSVTVRQNAVRVLRCFSDNERVRITLDHAAEYDESEYVRSEAKGS